MTKKFQWIAAALFFFVAWFSIYVVVRSHNALVLHPKGIIAESQLELMIVNTLLMLLIIFPTLLLLLVIAWKYRSNNRGVTYDLESPSYSPLNNWMFWLLPSIIVAIMSVITWNATHALDPYKPITSDVKPIKIQVVAIDWKWLFIYPEQGIATVNSIQFPYQTPIHLSLAADGSPMNSFWLPELCGQIYCMTGMITPLHFMANGPGVYRGKAAEINGDGYAKMTFSATSTSLTDFTAWVDSVKQSSNQLDNAAYQELLLPSIAHPITFYSKVEPNLFEKIVMKYMHPHG